MITSNQAHLNSLFPLVSIGIPTYNRAYSLRKAIESAISQDYPNFELVISDNASTDNTQALCQEVCQQYKRVRYIRQSSNIGPTANFIEVLKYGQGEFFMWLGDDDWLDTSYISQCVKVLVEQSDRALVSGKARYFQDDQFLYEGAAIDLLQELGQERLLDYYQKVVDNGIFYGVIRRAHLSTATLQNLMGGDWLLIASIAFTGKIFTLDNIFVNRTTHKMSSEIYFKKLASSLGLSNFHAKNPHLAIAVSVFKDIAWSSSVYSSLSRMERFNLAYRASSIILKRFIFIKIPRIDLVMRHLAVTALRKYLPRDLFARIQTVTRKYQ